MFQSETDCEVPENGLRSSKKRTEMDNIPKRTEIYQKTDWNVIDPKEKNGKGKSRLKTGTRFFPFPFNHFLTPAHVYLP